VRQRLSEHRLPRGQLLLPLLRARQPPLRHRELAYHSIA
jgi:hypothetical protein